MRTDTPITEKDKNVVTHAYIGRMNCGCVVAACIDNPRHTEQTREDIAEMEKCGYSVERVILDVARDSFTGCDCVKIQKKKLDDLERVAKQLADALIGNMQRLQNSIREKLDEPPVEAPGAFENIKACSSALAAWEESKIVGLKFDNIFVYAVPIAGDTTNEKGGEQRQELIPCPFCGGPPTIEERDGNWIIFCASTECAVAVECQSGFTKEDNINRWNTRK